MSSSGFHRVNGLKLYVHRFREEAVPPSGLTIVLLHGFMDAGATWDMVAPALARGGHEVIAPDLRGFGQSDYIGPGGYYHFPDYVADLAELIDSLAPRRLGLVGHSMGGTVAALYAGTYPERVERLALLEGMGPMGTEPAVAVDRMQAWLRTLREVSRQPKPLSSLQEAVERLSLHHPRVSREVIESRAKLLTRVDDSGRLIWAYDPLHRTTAPTPFSVESFQAFLRQIECPTLVVSGGVTGWHPADEAARLSCLKHAVTFELPHAGHMMHWTEPGALAHRMFTFFSEPPPAKKTPVPDTKVGTEESALMSSPLVTLPGGVPPSVPSMGHAAEPSRAGPVFGGAAAGLPVPPTHGATAPPSSGHGAGGHTQPGVGSSRRGHGGGG
jgi:pimeloyl-ACP methyl ester carboxylesterase